MNENADKHLDNLSRKVIGKSAIESPSMDFTKNLMLQINALNSSGITTYAPLISKWVWTLIGLVFAGIVWFVSSKPSEEKSSWLDTVTLDALSNHTFVNPLAELELSQTVMYSVVLFAIMFCVQIPLLKYYFNKRYEV